MNRRSLLLSLIALPLFQAAAIDLTPRWLETSFDGIPKRRLYFADGDKKYMLSIDQETEVRAQFGGSTFKFPKFPNIDFIVMPSKFKPADAFDEAKLVEYRENARSLLPARAHGAETVEEVSNPIPINQWKSYRIKMKFSMDSRTYMQEITFLNVNENDQLVLVTSAPDRDWVEAGERSWQILRSWQQMLPDDEGPPKGN